MANLPLDNLFEKHVPSAVRESKNSDFSDEAFLNLCHRVVDEFWMENKSNFVRHSTHKLEIERAFDVKLLDTCPIETLIKMFMASEIELRIEPRMTIEQRKKLGGVFQTIGLAFLRNQWSGYGRFCFSRGAQLFGDLRLHALEDECWYLEAKAAMLQAVGASRIKSWILFLFAGFGYKPFRLLYVSLLTVCAFSPAYALVEPSWSAFQCVSVSSMNYLAAIGYGDIRDTDALTQLMVVAQGFLSLVLNSTFFALLVRKWFRL